MTTAYEIRGYAHPAYAQALEEFGTPLSLPRCGGWILRRPVRGFSYFDAMGCYPLFSCTDWSSLKPDLDQAGSELVSLAAVIDPFGTQEEALLRDCFPDVVIPFKEHMAADLTQSPDDYVAAHHRRNAQKALQEIQIDIPADPTLYLEDWIKLYDVLIERHGIRGLSAFSNDSFARQLQVPGMLMFRATYEGRTAGMVLWYVSNGVAYYHLGAYTDEGYEKRASFALFWTALEYFAGHGVRWLNLGAGAGLSANGEEDGLTRFKKGWSNSRRTAWFCGRIFDRKKYDEIVKARVVPSGQSPTNYFPAYRQGEFG
jgi:hypothetical protein